MRCAGSVSGHEDRDRRKEAVGGRTGESLNGIQTSLAEGQTVEGRDDAFQPILLRFLHLRGGELEESKQMDDSKIFVSQRSTQKGRMADNEHQRPDAARWQPEEPRQRPGEDRWRVEVKEKKRTKVKEEPEPSDPSSAGDGASTAHLRAARALKAAGRSEARTDLSPRCLRCASRPSRATGPAARIGSAS